LEGGVRKRAATQYLAGCLPYFFGSLKEECVGNTIYPSHEQAKRALFEYLEIYSNRIRRHSTLGYVSPLVFEQLGNEQTKKNV
jgi:putative transposase